MTEQLSTSCCFRDGGRENGGEWGTPRGVSRSCCHGAPLPSPYPLLVDTRGWWWPRERWHLLPHSNLSPVNSQSGGRSRKAEDLGISSKVLGPLLRMQEVFTLEQLGRGVWLITCGELSVPSEALKQSIQSQTCDLWPVSKEGHWVTCPSEDTDWRGPELKYLAWVSSATAVQERIPQRSWWSIRRKKENEREKEER